MVSAAAQAAMEARRATEAKQQEDAYKKSAVTLERASKMAEKKIADMEANSALFSKEALDVIPKFVADELTMGRILGKGGFGTVKEIKNIQCKAVVGNGKGGKAAAQAPTGEGGFDEFMSFIKPEEDTKAKDQELQDKKFIADHCIRDGGDSRYCIKVSLIVVDIYFL